MEKTPQRQNGAGQAVKGRAGAKPGPPASMKPGPDSLDTQVAPLDRTGFLLFGGAIALLCYGLEIFGEHRLPPGPLAWLFLAAVGLLLAYAWHEGRPERPVLPRGEANGRGGLPPAHGRGARGGGGGPQTRRRYSARFSRLTRRIPSACRSRSSGTWVLRSAR